MSDQSLLEYLSAQYPYVRTLPDGSIACMRDLLYTRAILLGCTRNGFANRFCFENRALASKRFAELSSEDDVPEGFTARRP